MGFAKDVHSTNAMGGTELMKYGLQSRIDSALLDECQIFVSRVEEDFDESKIRIYWCHDLAEDPATSHLADEGWSNFHKIVFTSNWQMQSYIRKYNIPWSQCAVLHNAIAPFPTHEKPTEGPIRLAYWSTPHRGLNILVPVFDKLSEEYDIELDVFSSFKLYGWEDRDSPFDDLFEACRNHPKVNYHGAVDNETIRQSLLNTHILAYPSIWQETSCIVLMEAMSAGLISVHPNLGALYETAANWTHSYQWHEDLQQHANIFYHMLKNTIEQYRDPNTQSALGPQKAYADVFYTWDNRVIQWEGLIRSLLNAPRELPKREEMFVIKTS